MKVLQILFKNKYWLTLVIVALSLLFMHFYAPRFITEVHHPVIEFLRVIKGKKSSPKLTKSFPNGELVTYKSHDGLNLKAFVLPAKSDSIKGNVILVHGIRGNMNYLSNSITFYHKLGFNTIAIDLRAHGLSEGKYSTFGVKEKKDISLLIDNLSTHEKLKDLSWGIWGQSLGGAVSLQVLAHDKRIKWGIIESTFSSFNTIVNDYFEDYLGFSNQTFSDYLVNRAGAISDFDPDLAKPKNICSEIDQPILLIHGNADNKINIKYGRENYRALGSEKKKFVEIKGASHGNVWRKGNDFLQNEIINFLSVI